MSTAQAPETDQQLADLLEATKTIAVVGIKDDPGEDAFRVPDYMQRVGYRIVPVNPKLSEVLGEPCHTTVSEIDSPVDLINLFRASNHVAAHVDEILSLDPRPAAVWMQLGIHNGEAAQRLREAGIAVVQDRCIMVDHRRLMAGSGERAGSQDEAR